MKSVIVIALLAATAHAQVVDPYADPAPAQPARPIVHVTDQTVVFAEPSATSKVAFVANPNDDLYAGGVQGERGEWTYVELAAGAGWIPTARLRIPQRVATAEPHASPPPAPTTATAQADVDEAPRRPVGKRFVSGFRVGWMHIAHFDRPEMDRNGMSLKDQFGLKTPDMFLLGYEGFYRVIGHSWANVILVGNASVSGLDQSKFIPSANGLIGLEIDQGLQVAVGVSLTPDPVAPSHMIVAAGWTPTLGSITTPVHFLYIPDPDGNWRIGATLGMNW